MPFHVILETASTEDIGNAVLWLDFRTAGGSLGQAKLAFAEPSLKIRTVFEVAKGYLRQSGMSDPAARYLDNPPIPVDVVGEITTEKGNVGFALANLFSNDTLHMTALSRQYFQGGVSHQIDGVPKYHAPCVAACADGKTGQECVTCVHGEITVKICC